MMNHVNGPSGGKKAYEPAPKNQAAREEKNAGGIKVAKTDVFEPAGGVRLSEKAQNLLKQLQAKYGDTDFIIADYNSDEEASRLLASGKKEYSVLIDPETLEKMAADDSVREQYEGMMNDAKNEISSVVKELVENGQPARTVGATVSEDGSMQMFAELDEMTERRNEHIEESRKAAREERAEEKKKAEKEEKEEKAEKKGEMKVGKKEPKDRGPGKITRFIADSAEKLLDSIFKFFGIERKSSAETEE